MDREAHLRPREWTTFSVGSVPNTDLKGQGGSRGGGGGGGGSGVHWTQALKQMS